MPKKKILFTAFLAYSSYALANADVEEGPNNIHVGPVWNYVTSNWGNGLEQKGSLYGLLGSYSYIAEDTFYLNAEFMYTAGILKGSAGNDPTQEYVTELRLGYTLSLAKAKFMLTPFTGIASYLIHQSLSGHEDFNGNFWYVPVGLMGSYHLNSDWCLRFLGFGAPTFGGHYKEHDHSAHASTKPLWTAELPVLYLGSLPFELAIVPFVTGWGFHTSDTLTSQTNTYYGIRLDFGYQF